MLRRRGHDEERFERLEGRRRWGALNRRATGRSRRFAFRGGSSSGPGPDPQPFDPADIPGLEAWYRGDSYAGGVAMDRSGNGRDAAAIGTVNSVVSNGQIAFEFGGAGRLVADFGETLSQPLTIYVVWEADDNVNQVICDGIAVPDRLLIFSTTTSLRAGSAAASRITMSPASAGITYATAFVADGSTSELYGDNDFVVPGVTGNVGADGLGGFTLGAALDGTSQFGGRIFEGLVYAGAHDAETRAKLAGYFNARYGLNITT